VGIGIIIRKNASDLTCYLIFSMLENRD